MATNDPKNVTDEAQLEPTVHGPAWLGPEPAREGNTAFFYGTLMHPKILKRVITHEGAELEVAAAILFDHTRFHVKYCDYPAVISSDIASQVIGDGTLADDDKAVRGVAVKGLTSKDIELLDVFEGDEYSRDEVFCAPITEFNRLSAVDTQQLLAKSGTLPSPSSATVPTFVYKWKAPATRLSSEIWNYNRFLEENVWRWLDREPTDEEQRDMTQQRMDMQGIIITPQGGEGTIIPASGEATSENVTFGHSMKKYFGFAPEYVNLNCGSFGGVAKPVTEYCEALARRAEERPDRFFRFEYIPLLAETRQRVADLIGADTEEVVIMENATHAINTILHNFEWHDGDILVSFSTSYYAIARTLDYFTERGSVHPTLSTVSLRFPSSHAEILKQFREHLQNLPNKAGRKVVVVIDAIASNPGVTFPWEEMVKICKEEKAWSIIDAAHGLGITPINLRESQPDFWTTNCHKWLYTKRGCSVLYIPRRNHHLIRTSFPTSWGYVSPPAVQEFHKIFDWTGTNDLVPLLSIIPALDFRQSIGGEKKIMDYCDNLAKEGGKRMAEILGTEVMDHNGELLNSMVNVRLPLDVAPNGLLWDHLTLSQAMMQQLIYDHECMVAVFVHDEKWWIRASAQIWTEISDFEYVAQVLKQMCREKQS
ncbi:hypothetical protein M407DRAFT_243035 [Tulasnella calospora MUT 4182]|uniref:Aminotransferase class V domain-containing protein n=1 Tax=Tulasnella calospora MUT 4182 TaxID=1051891 RepID=A0A0C3L3S0_9AGAM|nr:hypothetical protein M407DRAFT_243035 [Tulasnella calospora MUT 4182]